MENLYCNLDTRSLWYFFFSFQNHWTLLLVVANSYRQTPGDKLQGRKNTYDETNQILHILNARTEWDNKKVCASEWFVGLTEQKLYWTVSAIQKENHKLCVKATENLG